MKHSNRWFFTLFLIFSTALVAQKSEIYLDPLKDYNHAISLYNNRDFVASKYLFMGWKGGLLSSELFGVSLACVTWQYVALHIICYQTPTSMKRCVRKKLSVYSPVNPAKKSTLKTSRILNETMVRWKNVSTGNQ